MKNKLLPTLLFILLLLVNAHSHAATIEQPLSNAAQEQTAQAIFHALRCVVCEGQSIADSGAPLAGQMRAHVREFVAQEKSQEEILRFFRERYGEQILMRPPFKHTTWLLWLAPLFILIAGGALIWRSTRPRLGD